MAEVVTHDSTQIRIDPLRQSLEAVGRRSRWVAWATGAVRMLRWWMLVVLLVLLADALWNLPSSARVSLLAILLVTLPIACLLQRKRHRDPEAALLRHARAIETHHQLEHNPLVNALLLRGSGGSDPLARTLSSRSHQHGYDTFQNVDAEVLVDRHALRRQGGWLWSMAVLWIVVGIMQPQFLLRGLERLLLPLSLRAPFSLTQFDVQVNPENPTKGESATITATITGPARMQDQADFVQVDDTGMELRRWPMHAKSDGKYAFTLRDVREQMHFRIEAQGAMSDIVTITPKDPPAQTSTNREDEPDASQSHRDTAATQPSEQPPGADTLAYLREHEPALYDRLQRLASEAQAIHQRASELADADPQSVDWQQWEIDLRSLEAQLGRFDQFADALASQVGEAADRAPQTQQRGLHDLAQILAELSLCQPGQLPSTGRPQGQTGEGDGSGEGKGAGERDAQGGRGQGQGFGEGQGAGGGSGSGGLMLGPAGAWAQGVEYASLADLGALAELLGPAMPSPLGGPLGQKRDATTPPGQQPPTPTGGYSETWQATYRQVDQPDAVIRKAPPAYRDLVSDYFDRLIQDQ